jgi:hypothetical protein
MAVESPTGMRGNQADTSHHHKCSNNSRAKGECPYRGMMVPYNHGNVKETIMQTSRITKGIICAEHGDDIFRVKCAKGCLERAAIWI